jgi:hypothetical protein
MVFVLTGYYVSGPLINTSSLKITAAYCTFNIFSVKTEVERNLENKRNHVTGLQIK